jgi:hypothetical protein
MKRFKSLLSGQCYHLSDVDSIIYESLFLGCQKSPHFTKNDKIMFQDMLLRLYGARACTIKVKLSSR